jgi:hypothetical protein
VNNETKGIGRRIFEVLLFGMSFLLFIPTGALLAAAIVSVYGNDWMQVGLYLLGVLSFTVLVGITALVPQRGFSMLGMFIVIFAMATFGSGTTRMALSQIPPVLNFAAMVGMSAALVITHTALWVLVRNMKKPAPTETTASASAPAGTALKTTKP